jgi:prepilin-type N-terminal cleavage/methylation domain-containing protein
MRRGFSLVELLIALAIITAIVRITAGIFQPVVADQEVEVLKANLRVMRQAIFDFYNDHGRYPYEGQDEFGNVVTILDDQTSELVQGVHDGKASYPARRRRYLLAIPQDPTLTSETARTAGWKLIFAEAGQSNKALASVRGVRDVKSLNPQYSNL